MQDKPIADKSFGTRKEDAVSIKYVGQQGDVMVLDRGTGIDFTFTNGQPLKVSRAFADILLKQGQFKEDSDE